MWQHGRISRRDAQLHDVWAAKRHVINVANSTSSQSTFTLLTCRANASDFNRESTSVAVAASAWALALASALAFALASRTVSHLRPIMHSCGLIAAYAVCLLCPAVSLSVAANRASADDFEQFEAKRTLLAKALLIVTAFSGVASTFVSCTYA